MGYLDDDSEAYHLAEIEDSRGCDWDEEIDDWIQTPEREAFLSERERSVKNDEELYICNKSASVGAKITCAGPLCHKQFIKKSYQQAFCCTKHKDQFWNRREAHFGWRKPID